MSGSVAIIIPALNEEAALPHVLAAIPDELAATVIIVDNGSTDRTAEIAVAGGAIVLQQPERGYGAACLMGIEHLTGNNPPEILVILDADFADDPGLLPDLFIRPIRDGEVDIVLSTRTQGGAEPGSMTPVQVLGNHLQIALLRLRFGLRLTDMGPMRAIRFDRLLELGMEDRTWGWNVEMACKAARRGLRVREVAVPYRNRIGVSKISGTLSGVVRAGGKILYAFAKYGR